MFSRVYSKLMYHYPFALLYKKFLGTYVTKIDSKYNLHPRQRMESKSPKVPPCPFACFS